MYDQWQAVMWGTGAVALPQAAFGYPLVSVPGLMGTMEAARSATGQREIRYNPATCDGMGADATFFVLFHEIGHHYHQHDGVAIPANFMRNGVIRGLETQADEFACAQLIQRYPMEAKSIYEAAHAFFVNANGPGGGTHPSDRERATNMEVQWRARCAVCRFRITMSDSQISPLSAKNILAALNVPAWGPASQDHAIALMEAGQQFLSEPFAYGEAMRRLEQIDVARRLFWGEPHDPGLGMVAA